MNLLFSVSGDNYGGVDRFWFAHEDDILTVDAGDQVILKEGKVWSVGKSVRYTMEFSNPSQDRRGGVVYNPNLSGTVKKYRPELETVLEGMRGERFALIIKDKNGYLYQVGRPSELLTFTTDQITGGIPSDSNGFKWSFKGQTTKKPIPRVLEIETDGEVTAEPVIGSPVSILINGELVALVPPGGTFSITTEYTLEHAIL